MKIHFLNHSSVLFEYKSVRLLTDPWYFDTCFDGGWGLRYVNPNALEIGAQANYLWISHFHADHFHVPTLKKLLALNPNITVLGNHSYNFQLDEAMRGIGFTNIIRFDERKPITIDEGITLTRYPTTGIDNMLHIKHPDFSILNYNDCNIPPLAQKLLKKKIGPIDILMSNYNHAGKLLLYPYPNDEVIRRKLIDSFSGNYTIFNPLYVLPYASHHYYRAAESRHQNTSHITGSELATIDPKIVDWQIGDVAHFDSHANQLFVDTSASATVETATLDTLAHGPSETERDLTALSRAYTKKLRRLYGPLAWLLPNLSIRIVDFDVVMTLGVFKGLTLAEPDTAPHIVAHSSSLRKWWSKPYGTDSFVVGAHFELVTTHKIPMYWQIILGILVDNKLDLQSILTMLFRPGGIRFLVNRREEILGILTSFQLAASYQKQDD